MQICRKTCFWTDFLERKDARPCVSTCQQIVTRQKPCLSFPPSVSPSLCGRCPAVLPDQPHSLRTGLQHFGQDNLWKDGEKHGFNEIKNYQSFIKLKPHVFADLFKNIYIKICFFYHVLKKYLFLQIIMTAGQGKSMYSCVLEKYDNSLSVNKIIAF